MSLVLSRLCRLTPKASSLPSRSAGLTARRRSLHSRHTSINDHTRFTFITNPNQLGQPTDYWKLLDAVKTNPHLANPTGHNAAVLLVTPEYSKALEDGRLMAEFVQLMSAGANVSQFHVVASVVDQMRKRAGLNDPGSGISVLRGHLDDLLPGLWEAPSPKSKDDGDAASALVFDLGRVSVTLPLSNTIFHNQRPSTLLTYRFEMVDGTARLTQQAEKHSQTVNLTLDPAPQSIADIALNMNLLPITRPRRVVNSFGNIVRRVEVDGESIPASTELEDVLNNPSEEIKSRAPEGVWAVVAPKSHPIGYFESICDSSVHPRSESSQFTLEIQRLLAEGGRIYKILSGGGGWGTKKGLLSLDPQESHFALSEEEEMDRFMREMADSGFAPVGSSIQFFLAEHSLAQTIKTPPFALGVAGDTLSDVSTNQPEGEEELMESFGAFSNKGLFLSWPEGSDTASDTQLARWKLSVPNSAVSAGGNEIL